MAGFTPAFLLIKARPGRVGSSRQLSLK